MRPARTRRTPATRPDPLARLVGDPERFGAEVWGRRPQVHRGGDVLPDVLTLADVDGLLASATRRPEVRLMRDGQAVDPRSWTSHTRLGGRWVADVVDAAAVARHLHDGATVVLQSLHRTVPAVGRFAAALEQQVSHPVQVNAYLTPPGSAGLAPHADGHDVLAAQLHGTKDWWVDGLGEVTLGAGDVLYLPTSTRHRAATTDRSSLHLTIGLIPVTYRDVLQRLLRRAAPSLDAPLPLGYAAGSVDLEAGLADALQDAAKALVDADVASTAELERGRRRPRVRPDGRIASVVALDDLGADSVVRLRAGPTPRLAVDDDGRLRLDLGDRVVHLPAGARAALDRLLDGGPCRVGDLPELTASSRLVVARRLVVEGMLVVEGA
jgi:mannose-6-phosphate isomerase-like protein (cupin superfamily)